MKHASYVDCLLADSQHTPIAVYSVESPDNGQ